jgi:hypothetical protein
VASLNGSWVQHTDYMDGQRATSLRFQLEDGTFPPETKIELVYERVDMGDGTFAISPRYVRSTPPAPRPDPLAEEVAQ